MMFTYWLPGHSHPMLLQSPLRCALSLGDLPADPFAQQFHHLEMVNGEMMTSAHSFPLMRPTPKKGNNKTIGQQEWREEEEEEDEDETILDQRKRRRIVGRRSIGTQTDEEEQQREWIKQIDEEDEEMDDEWDNICAEIATQLLAMADRWEAQIKGRKEAAKRSNGGGGLWEWICAKLF